MDVATVSQGRGTVHRQEDALHNGAAGLQPPQSLLQAVDPPLASSAIPSARSLPPPTAPIWSNPTARSLVRFLLTSAFTRAVWKAHAPGAALYSFATFGIPLGLNEMAPHVAVLILYLCKQGVWPAFQQVLKPLLAAAAAVLPARVSTATGAPGETLNSTPQRVNLEEETNAPGMATGLCLSTGMEEHVRSCPPPPASFSPSPTARALEFLAAALVTSTAVPLAVMLFQQFNARAIFQDTLRCAGIPLVSSARHLSATKLAIAAVPLPRLLNRNIACEPGVVYARVSRKVRGGVSLPREVFDLKLDLYWHRERRLTPSAPVFMYIHGGGWITGHRSHHSLGLLYELARRGWVVATINYRLAPRSPFPNMLYDCKRALVWLRSHVSSYGGNPHFIVVGGESAGGHLALLMGLTANVASCQAPHARQPDSDLPLDVDASLSSLDTSVQGVVNLYGVCDWTDSGHQYLKRDSAGGVREFVGRLVLQKRYTSHVHEFIRGSPFWWVQGDVLCDTLAATGITVEVTGSAANTHKSSPKWDTHSEDAASGTSNSTSSGTGESVVVSSPAAAHEVLHSGAKNEGEVFDATTGLHYVKMSGSVHRDDVVDMHIPTIPPIFTVHGTNDTLVPYEDATRFHTALKARRIRDATHSTAPTPLVSDVMVTLPGAHHAFNFILSARTFAMGDAVADWVSQLHSKWEGVSGGHDGAPQPPANLTRARL